MPHTRPVNKTPKRLREFFNLHPYRYDDRTLIVDGSHITQNTLPWAEIASELIEVHREGLNIIVYTPISHVGLQEGLLNLGFCRRHHFQTLIADCQRKAFQKQLYRFMNAEQALALLGCYEFFVGKAQDHPGISQLLEQYWEEHAELFFDGVGTRESVFMDQAEYHYFYDPTGKALALTKGIPCLQDSQDRNREAEITIGRGSPRQNIAMMIYSFDQEIKKGTRQVEVNLHLKDGKAELSSTLQGLGMEIQREIAVYNL